MANQTTVPLQLHWERAPDGRFAISVVLTIALQSPTKMENRLMPIHRWVLTPDEENKLKLALQGITVVNEFKVLSNGRK